MADFPSHEAPAHKAGALPVMLPGKLTGRDLLLAQVYSHLKANKPVLLYGAAGIGKTALAAALASAYTELPGGALWLNVENASLDELIVRVGRAYDVAEIMSANTPLGLVGAAASTLTSHKPLLVLDGRHNAVGTMDFIMRCADGLPAILVSNEPIDGPWTPINVGALDAEPAMALLKNLAGLEGQAGIDDDLDELTSILDYNPYAIVVAAGTLRTSKQPPATYLQAFEQIPSSSGATPPLLALTIGFRTLHKSLQGILLMLGASFTGGASAELLSMMAGAPQETVEQVMNMLAASYLVERYHRYETSYYHLHEITVGFAQTWLRSQGQLDALHAKVRDAVVDYVKKYSVDSPAAHNKLATEMDMIMEVARWCAETGDRDSVNQIVVSLTQAGGFISERGYVYELLQLRGLAASYTQPFPSNPTPSVLPVEPAVYDTDDEVEDEEDFVDEDDFEDEEDFDEEDDFEDEDEDFEDESAPVASVAVMASLLELEEDSQAAAPVAGDELTQLQTALRAAKQEHATEREAELLEKIGQIQAARKMDTEAIVTYSEALNAYETLDEVEDILKTLDTLSALMVKTENSNAAVMHATRGIGLAEEIGDLESKMFLLVTLADARQQLGESGEAMRNYGQALEIARNEGDEQNEALILYKLGYAQLDNSQPEVAADTWEQALKLFRGQNKRDYEGRVLGALGSAYGDLSRWEEAINFHTSALYIAREVKDKDVEALELSNLGYASVQANQLGQAVTRYRQALHLAYQADDRDNIISNIVDLVRLLVESQRHLDIADLLINSALPLDPTDRDVLKLKERITAAKMQAYASDVKLLPVNGTAKDYAANAYKLLDG